MHLSMENLYRAGFFSIVEFQFAAMLGRISGDTTPNVLLGAALALNRADAGDVCVNIPAVAGKPICLPDGQGNVTGCWPDAAEWLRVLSASPLVSSGKLIRPLVLDEKGRLYLYQFYMKEAVLADLIVSRATCRATNLDEPLLTNDLHALFGETNGETENGQCAAAQTAVRKLFTVITGGPGSGKTTLVVEILLLICRQFHAAYGGWPHIELLAPTGKAAQRIAETIQQGSIRTMALLGMSDDEATRDALPKAAATIHRVLHRIRQKERRMGSWSEGYLSTDVVVVDEASMVDLSLMYDLLRHIKPDARVIVVGDKDQLASVESGALLADLYDASRAPESSLFPVTIHLEGSYRFGKKGGIGRLAQAVNIADADTAIEILKNDSSGEIEFHSMTDTDKICNAVFKVATPYLSTVLTSPLPQDALNGLRRFRILSPHRTGPLGQGAVNRHIENQLEKERYIRRDTPDYLGRPVIVTRNNYAEQLFNGDVGIIIQGSEGNRVAAFETGSGLRTVSTAALPDVETVFAMTVHKSQGSEFDTVILVLPQAPSPVLVRELMYTAVTRAKTKLIVFGTEAVVRHAILAKSERTSGLKDRLLASRPPEIPHDKTSSLHSVVK